MASREVDPRSADDNGGLSTDGSVETDLQRSSIGRNVTALLASQATTWVLSTFLAIVQPRFLGPAAQGQLRLAFSLWTIAQVLIGLGTALFLTLEIARDRSRGLSLVGPVLVIRSLAFVVASIILALYVVGSGADRQFAAIMAVFGVSIFFASTNDALMAVFIGLERMSVIARANILARVFGTTVAIVVLFAGGDALSVVTVSACANLLAMLILAKALRSVSGLSFRAWSANWGHIVAASSGFLLAGVILTTYQQVDTVVMAELVGSDALGWYGTADALFGSLLFFATIVTGAIFPVIGRLHVDDPTAIPPLVRRSSSLLVIAGVPIGFGIAAIALPLAPFLYGEEFRETGQVLMVLGPVIVLTFGTIVCGTVALATGRQRFWNMIMVAAIVISIPLDVVFVPWADENFENGAIGGAMSYVVTEALLLVFGIWRVTPYLLERVFVWRVVRVVLAGVFMFAITWPLRDRFLAIPIAVAIIGYSAALLALRVPDADDRAAMRDLFARVGVRRSGSGGAEH